MGARGHRSARGSPTVRPLAVAVLVGWVASACGSRTDLIGSPAGTTDAGTVADATAMQAARSMPDATATVDAGDMPESGSIADVPGTTACHVAQLVAALGCDVVLPPTGCGAFDEYAVSCSFNVSFSPPDGCFDPCPSCNGMPGYCCPCLGPDAGVGCVNIDPSTYDRSCSNDSDCMLITSGAICPPVACLCAKAAINVNESNRYSQTWQTVSALPRSSVPCRCGDSYNSPRPVCSHGMCTVE